MDVGGGGDRENGDSRAWLSASGHDRRLQAPSFACDPVIDREWVWEARLDQSQPRRPERPRRVVAGDKQPEVQLGD